MAPIGLPEIGLFEAIYSARSIRRLKPDPVPEELITRILDAAIHALVTGASVTLFSDLITAVGVFFWLFILNWKLALFSVILAPLSMRMRRRCQR